MLLIEIHTSVCMCYVRRLNSVLVANALEKWPYILKVVLYTSPCMFVAGTLDCDLMDREVLSVQGVL